MTIQEHIVNDMKIAMREKNVEVRDLLRVVIGEFNREGKDVSDEKATATIKKMVQNAKDQGNDSEATILEVYLPQQMDENELTLIINQIITVNGFDSMKDMGKVMSELKNDHAGQYDGKMASTLVRELLK